MVNFNDVRYIIPDGFSVDTTNRFGKNAYFESYTTYPAKYYMEIYECIGEINIFASNDYDDLKAKKNLIEENVPTLTGDHLVLSYDLDEPGPFYFVVEQKQSKHAIKKVT